MRAIGYVEYGYAKQTGMPMASLEKKSGKFIKPDLASGQKALAGVALPAKMRAWITDPAEADAYPIVTYTWLLCYKKYPDPKTAETLKSVIKDGLSQGQSFSAQIRLHSAACCNSRSGHKGARSDFMRAGPFARSPVRRPDWRSSVIGFSGGFRWRARRSRSCWWSG